MVNQISNNILRDRNYLLYLLIVFSMRAGDAIYKIALILFIIKIGGSASSVGMLLISTLLPSVIFGPIAGIFSDRFNQKVVIHISNIIRIAILVFIPYTMNTYLLYLFSFLLSVSTLFAAPGQKVILPLIVKKSDISTAAGYIATVRSIIDTIIPIFGAGLVVIIGFLEAFYLNASLYLIASILLFFLRIKVDTNMLNNKERNGILSDITEGMKYLFINRDLKVITLISVITLAFSAGMDILIPIHILQNLNFPESSYGLLMGGIGAGIAAGGIIIPKIKRQFNLSILSILGLSITLDGLSFLFFGYLSNSIVYAMIIMILAGIASAGFLVMVDSFMQTEVEQRFLGRTYSSFFTFSNIFSVLVMVLVSFLVENVGTTYIFTICSLGILLSGLYTLYLNFFPSKLGVNNKVKNKDSSFIEDTEKLH